MNDRDFPEKLRVEMARQNISTAQLAEETGISARLINFYRMGDRLPKWKNLKLLVNALGCDVNELV